MQVVLDFMQGILEYMQDTRCRPIAGMLLLVVYGLPQ